MGFKEDKVTNRWHGEREIPDNEKKSAKKAVLALSPEVDSQRLTCEEDDLSS